MAITGKCRCGATQFEVSVAPAAVTRCTCSFCSKRGYLWAYYEPSQFKVISKRDQARFGDGPNKNFHCGVCACGTYSESPDWTGGSPDFSKTRIGVNARLFEDFDLEAVPVKVIDGKNLW